MQKNFLCFFKKNSPPPTPLSHVRWRRIRSSLVIEAMPFERRFVVLQSILVSKGCCCFRGTALSEASVDHAEGGQLHSIHECPFARKRQRERLDFAARSSEHIKGRRPVLGLRKAGHCRHLLVAVAIEEPVGILPINLPFLWDSLILVAVKRPAFAKQ